MNQQIENFDDSFFEAARPRSNAFQYERADKNELQLPQPRCLTQRQTRPKIQLNRPDNSLDAIDFQAARALPRGRAATVGTLAKVEEKAEEDYDDAEQTQASTQDSLATISESEATNEQQDSEPHNPLLTTYRPKQYAALSNSS